MKGIWCV